MSQGLEDQLCLLNIDVRMLTSFVAHVTREMQLLGKCF